MCMTKNDLINDVVASLTVSMTQDQVSLIKSYTKMIQQSTESRARLLRLSQQNVAWYTQGDRGGQQIYLIKGEKNAKNKTDNGSGCSEVGYTEQKADIGNSDRHTSATQDIG